MAARILVIEDNATNLQLMVYLLRAFGHEVLTAITGEEGLEAARRESPRADHLRYPAPWTGWLRSCPPAQEPSGLAHHSPGGRDSPGDGR